MNLVIGKTYQIILKINEYTLTYTGTITSEDTHFISFLDKYNKEYNYNKSLIISIEEVKNDT